MGPGPFGASSPLFLRNGQIRKNWVDMAWKVMHFALTAYYSKWKEEIVYQHRIRHLSPLSRDTGLRWLGGATPAHASSYAAISYLIVSWDASVSNARTGPHSAIGRAPDS